MRSLEPIEFEFQLWSTRDAGCDDTMRMGDEMGKGSIFLTRFLFSDILSRYCTVRSDYLLQYILHRYVLLLTCHFTHQCCSNSHLLFVVIMFVVCVVSFHIHVSVPIVMWEYQYHGNSYELSKNIEIIKTKNISRLTMGRILDISIN